MSRLKGHCLAGLVSVLSGRFPASLRLLVQDDLLDADGKTMRDVWSRFELQFLPGPFPKEHAAICSRVVLSYLQPVEDTPLIATTGATAVFQGSLPSLVNSDLKHSAQLCR